MEKEAPQLFIISGCNGSGKTTASYSILPDFLGCNQYVNSDEFAKGLSPFDPAAASMTAGRLMIMKFKYLMDKRQNFGIETTLATRSLLKLIMSAKENGYETNLMYFWLNSADLAVARVRDRVNAGGHNIPENIIRRRYLMGLQYFFDTYMPVSDKWVLVDNSKNPFQIVAQGNQHSTTIHDTIKYEHIWSIAHPAELETDI